jgi:hypothetical protein
MKPNRLSLVSGFRMLVVVAAVALLVPLSAGGQQDESFAAELDGRKTWTIRFGLGSPIGLAGASLAAGSISLDQTLSVDLRAEALGILAVEGHFDDRLSESLQSLVVYLDTERLDGIFGDFTVEGLAGFNAQRRKAIGARLDYSLGAATLTGVAARFEGVTESKTFIGATAEAETVFSASRPDRPWVEQPYGSNIDGLYAHPIAGLYVEEISTVRLEIPPGDAVRSVLVSYGVEYVAEILAEEPEVEIDKTSFTVIGEDEQVLLLDVVPQELVRTRIEDAIDAYNEAHDLSGSEAREYPFVRNSAYEEAFLDALSDLAVLRVDDGATPIRDAIRRTYYDLGRTGVVESSLEVEISLDGSTFVPITRSGLSGFDASVHPASGILEIDFPASFFEETDPAIRVRFTYTVTGGTYLLGFSLVPGSERITVNGEPLPEESYEIDYEIGLLVLLTEIAETDVILVEYERFGSGLGGTSDYARYFVGLELDLPLSDAVELTATLQSGFDDPNSVADASRIRTAPNRQLVGGVLGTVELEDLSADFAVGYGSDRFPPGANERPAEPNEITAIGGNDDYVFVGHRAGFSVLHGGVWRGYGTADGLSGGSVRSILVDAERAYFGTNAGLTVVRLAGASPLGRAANWLGYGEIEGLSEPSVRALVLQDETLWIGTDGGLVSVPVEALDDPTAWAAPTLVDIAPITSLVSDGDVLYVGTALGAYRYAPASSELTQLAGSGTLHVRSMAASDGLLYVAADEGLRAYADGAGAGWIVVGRPVTTVVAFDGELLYATEKGLTRSSDGEVLYEDWSITVLWAEDGESLWVGTRASAEYALMLWRLGDGEAGYENLTLEIDGRDTTRFGPMDAEENTAQGVFARGSFRHEDEGLELRGDVRVVAPGYRAIGSGSSSGFAEWSLDAAFDLGEDAQLTAYHEYTLRDSSGAWLGQTANRVSFVGSFGPKLSASASHNASNDDLFRGGPESSWVSLNSSISDTLFGEVLDVSLSWSGAVDSDYVNETTRQESALSARASLELIPGARIAVGWKRPLSARDGAWRGSERWTLDGDWSGDLSIGGLDLGASADASRALTEGHLEWELEGDAGLDVSSFDLYGWTFAPTLDGNAAWEDGATTLGGKAVLRSSRDRLTIRTTISEDLSGLGEPVTRRNGKLSVSASFTGSDVWRPSLTYSLSRSTTVHKGVGSAATTNHSLSGHLNWTGEGATDSLSLTVRVRDSASSRRVTASLENSYQLDVTDSLARLLAMLGSDAERASEPRTPEDAERAAAAESPYPTAMLRFDVDGDYRSTESVPDVDLSATGRLDVSLSEMWSLSLSGSYLVGTRTTGGLYHSFLFELTVAVDF